MSCNPVIAWKPIGEVAEVLIGIPTVAPDLGRVTDDLPRLLSVRCLSGGRVDAGALIPAVPKINLSDRYQVRAGDVILPARSTNLEVAIVPPELDGTYFNATLIVIRCGDSLNPLLLKAYLSHPQGMEQLELISQSSTAQKNITVKALSTVQVPVPPLEQQHFLAHLIETSDLAYDQAVQAAQMRRQVAQDVLVNMLVGKVVR